jgi:RNA polymerase sigma factor (sigma-70 family)
MKSLGSRAPQLQHEFDDNLLWRQFKEGNKQALGQMAGEYYRVLFNYGTRFSKDTEFIRDCIQEVFSNLWERREFISIPLSVKSYLFKSLRNIFIDESIRLKRFRQSGPLLFDPHENDEPFESRLIQFESDEIKIKYLKRIISNLNRRPTGNYLFTILSGDWITIKPQM